MKYEIDKEEKYYLLKPKVEKIDSTLSPTLKADLITFEVEGAKNMIVNVCFIFKSKFYILYFLDNNIFSNKIFLLIFHYVGLDNFYIFFLKQ